MTLGSVLDPSGTISILGFRLPMLIVPFLSLVLTQLIIPNASFVGHFSGIVGAYMIHWKFFFWFHDYLFIATFIIFIIVTMWSLRTRIAVFGRLLSVFEGPVNTIQTWLASRFGGDEGLLSRLYTGAVSTGSRIRNMFSSSPTADLFPSSGRSMVHENHEVLHDLDDYNSSGNQEAASANNSNNFDLERGEPQLPVV